MGHEFGVRLALIGFATAVFQAGWMQSGLSTGVQDGLAALIVFYGLGFVCGETARLAVEEDVARQQQLKPANIPSPASADRN